MIKLDIMKKILIVSGHPDLNDSFANKTILEEVHKLLPEAEIAYLDKLYPDFQIDVQKEQERLLRADIIVLQYPLFWYTAPSLLHRWIEKTFTHGFSHGKTGDKLKGKQLVLSFTAGAPEKMYSPEGPQQHSIDDFLTPYRQMAHLCQLEWSGYIFSGGLSYASRHDEKELARMKEKSIRHAQLLVEKLKGME